MKYNPLTLVLFLSSTFGFSQTGIDLKTVPVNIRHQDFYIEKVFDEGQTNGLGTVKDGLGKEVNPQLRGGTSKAVKAFMDIVLPKSNGSIPINIAVKEIKIEQVRTGITEITARAYVELIFYDEGGTERYKIGHYEDQVYPDVQPQTIYNTHEQRIRAALEYCLLSFIGHRAMDVKASPLEDVLDKNPDSFVHEPEPYKPLGKWIDILTFKKRFDRYHDGWEVAYNGFADSEKDFIVPFEIGYGQTKSKSDVIRNHGYSSIDAYALGTGFSGYIKILPGLYADLGFNVPLGMEVLKDLEDRKSTNFLIGIGAHQGIKIIPWKDFGIVIGAGVFQKLQTSKVYKRNFGLELEVGFNF